MQCHPWILEDDFALVALFVREGRKKGNCFFTIGRMSVKKPRIEATSLRIDLVRDGIG